MISQQLGVCDIITPVKNAKTEKNQSMMMFGTDPKIEETASKIEEVRKEDLKLLAVAPTQPWAF